MKLLQGDCLELMKQIPDSSVDAIITDPPYGYTSAQFDKAYFDVAEFFRLAFAKCKQNAFLVFFGRGIKSYQQCLQALQAGFHFADELVWDKRAITSPFMVPCRRHELIFVFKKGSKTPNKCYRSAEEHFENVELKSQIRAISRMLEGWKKDKTACIEFLDNLRPQYDRVYKSKFHLTTPEKNMKKSWVPLQTFKIFKDGGVVHSILNFSRDSTKQNIHPTQKPVALLKTLLQLYSNAGETVLDPFMGSGTTGVACRNLGREFIGIELDPVYFANAKKRIESTQEPLLVEEN